MVAGGIIYYFVFFFELDFKRGLKIHTLLTFTTVCKKWLMEKQITPTCNAFFLILAKRFHHCFHAYQQLKMQVTTSEEIVFLVYTALH